MLSKVKMYIGIALVAVVGVLYAMLGIRTKQRDEAVTERDTAIKVNESNEHTQVVQDAIKKESDKVDVTTDSDVVSELRDRYTRD